MRIVTFLLAVMLILALNVFFIGVHYSADRAVSVDTVKQRIRAAVASDNIIPEEFPWKTAGIASPLNAIGLNHRADCLMNLMALHRNANPVLNAVSPTYYRTDLDSQICDVVKALAEDRVSERQLEQRSRYFFWYGAKPVTQFLLTKFDFYQIYQLIRQLSYFFIALLLALAFKRSPEAGLAFIPVAGLAILGSGLPYNGGIVFALPYLSALVLSLGYILAQSRRKESIAPEILYMVFAGGMQAFFFMLDGSLILISALFIYAIYFLDRARRSASRRLKRTLGLMLVFYSSFAASMLIKQGFAGIFDGFDTVWATLQSKAPTLFSMNSSVLENLSNQYVFSILGHGGLAHYAQNIGMVSWALAAAFALLFALLRHTGRPLVDMLVFGLIGLATLARFVFLPASSAEASLFVSRYWFVLIAFGVSALIWMFARYRYQEPMSDQRVLVAEPDSENLGETAIAADTRGSDATKEVETFTAEPVSPAEEVDETNVAEEKDSPEALEEAKINKDAADSNGKTETTKESSRLTIEVPRFLDGS